MCAFDSYSQVYGRNLGHTIIDPDHDMFLNDVIRRKNA